MLLTFKDNYFPNMAEIQKLNDSFKQKDVLYFAHIVI